MRVYLVDHFACSQDRITTVAHAVVGPVVLDSLHTAH